MDNDLPELARLTYQEEGAGFWLSLSSISTHRVISRYRSWTIEELSNKPERAVLANAMLMALQRQMPEEHYPAFGLIISRNH